MPNKFKQDAEIERVWRTYLTTGEVEPERRQRRFFRMLPGTHRCNICYAPFEGVGGRIVRLIFDKRPSNMNPQVCNICELFAREHQGGAEVELSLLFADVRGSTNLAERMNPTEFSRVINRFYETATHVMVHTNALIDKIIGDQVAGMYVPGHAGAEHARQAIEAAQKIMKATGHGGPDEPWIPLGAGVHTGTAFVGSIRSEEGTANITVLGDTPNTAARLSTIAKEGEILVSEAAYVAAGLQNEDLEKRELELKGKNEPISVYVLTNY
ncbi:MAG: adenylate/guanylate cyclase domain-containing protein [Chloroflexota bacterium]|jgi:adenylate cyclase